jgi:hypothetical protein
MAQQIRNRCPTHLFHEPEGFSFTAQVGRCEDAHDATSALHQTPAVDPGWREEFMQDVAVLRNKLDILRTLMNRR